MSIIYLHDQYNREPDDPPPLRVVSTFSGIGAASVSWSPAHFEFVAYSEPAAFPAHVLHYRRGASRPLYLPDGFKALDYATLPCEGVPNFGDIRQITDDDLLALGQVDILEGGSPCQAFSVAGLREGLADDRGNLLLSFCELAERMRKINGLRYVLWENVSGVLSDKTNGFGCLLASLAGEPGCPLQPPGKRWTNAGRVYGSEGREVAWRTIEASLWGLPQRRKRVFALAALGPSSTGIGRPADILFNTSGSEWAVATGFPTRQAVVATYRGAGGIKFNSAESRLRDPSVRKRLRAEANIHWLDSIGLKAPPSEPLSIGDSLIHPKKSGTLCASGAGTSRSSGMASELDFVVVTKSPDGDGLTARRFTPLECERLQGFPDYWTDVPFKERLPRDSLRYAALGNSMPCTVMSWIGHQLEVHSFMADFADVHPHLLNLPRGRGRPPKNKVAMTNAERQRLHRQRRKQRR